MGGRRENGGAARGSCSVFIHLLISLLTSRLFISLSIYLFIHPSTHSAGNQPCIHSSPPIYRCGCHPPLPPNHASISLSIFPFPLSPPPLPAPHLLSISPVTSSLPDSIVAAFLIYLYRIFAPFHKNTAGARGGKKKSCGVMKDTVLFLLLGNSGGRGGGVGSRCWEENYSFLTNPRTRSFASF